MDETTPLLAQNDHDGDTPTTQPTSSRIITILIWSSIIASTFTFLYSLTVWLVVRLSPYYDFLHWGMRESIEVLLPLGFLCAVASLFSLFKLTVPTSSAWLLVNLLLDPSIVCLLLLNPALRSFELADWGHCIAPRRGFPAPGFEARCESFASAINAVILVGLVFQMAVLSLHLVFFICDVVLGVKKLLRYTAGWRFPTVWGGFTVEFTVKFLGQRDDTRGLVDC